MFSTLALTTLLTLAPAQGGSLKLENARTTYGFLGADRPNAKLLPGDTYFVSFDIDGLKVAEDGKVLYSMGMQLANKEGKIQFKKEPKELEAYNSLGGSRLPAFAVTEIGLDTPPGDYTLTVAVTDRAAKTTDTLVRRFEVLPPGFGFVRVNTTYDFKGEVSAPPLGVPGQTFWVNFGLVGFELDEKKKQPNLSVELRVFDENDKPTLAKPITGDATEVTEQFKKFVPMQFVLNLNRSGRYRLELVAKDNVGKKSAKHTMNFTISDPAK